MTRRASLTGWEKLEDHRELLQDAFVRGHTHTAIDVALDLRGAAAGRIADVLIETYGPGFEIVKEMNPRSPYQAKFSLAYCVSADCSKEPWPRTILAERFGPEGVRDTDQCPALSRSRDRGGRSHLEVSGGVARSSRDYSRRRHGAARIERLPSRQS